jgi:hypothetical protein
MCLKTFYPFVTETPSAAAASIMFFLTSDESDWRFGELPLPEFAIASSSSTNFFTLGGVSFEKTREIPQIRTRRSSNFSRALRRSSAWIMSSHCWTENSAISV